MKKILTIVGLMLFSFLSVQADHLDFLREKLEEDSIVQEKVYVHMDNSCYFIGDTIWYKAYVLRADDLTMTDLSKILYVELLSPDGLVVERQRVVVGNRGYSCGQFTLTDSLYSGYYEVRAYTRWMLNFNVGHRSYTRDAKHMFYNNQMARDFFRDWEGLYSRVFPVYSKPESDGDYSGRYMYSRPKQRIVKSPAEALHVTFYPEGGQLIEGTPGRVAFEVCNQDGEAVSVQGKLSNGTPLQTTYMGRGVVEVTPTGKQLSASFTWKGKNYNFNLPKAEDKGVSLRYDDTKVTILGAAPDKQGTGCAAAVFCRGQLVWFMKLEAHGEEQSFTIPTSRFPTGVNELMVLDAKGKILASRLFFVNNHDTSVGLNIDTRGKTDFQPYEPISLTAKAEVPALFSISVRDAGADEMSYDDGNIMTDMLLSSELKGFIAHPAYYFESDDEVHRQALDLLMMVQGWRRYRPAHILYEPEQSLVYEGTVHKMLEIDMLDDMDQNQLLGMKKSDIGSTMLENMSATAGGVATGVGQQDGLGLEEEEEELTAEQEYLQAVAISETPTDGLVEEGMESYLGVNHGNVKGNVIVEAEITDGHQVAGAAVRVDNKGHFAIQLPAFYDEAYLTVKAYAASDSLKKCMTAGSDKGMLNENIYPDYYVKQDMFFPVFTHPYSYYQCHLPDIIVSDLGEVDDDYHINSADGDVHADKQLKTIHVKARRRGKRGIDYTKPAHVVDAYKLYNEATDRGISWGAVNMATFPYKAAYTLYANMNRSNQLNIRGRIDNYTYFQNYEPEGEGTNPRRTEASIRKDLHLNRINNIRFYTDFEMRSLGDSLPYRTHNADITVVYETFPDDGKQYTYRDRRYLYSGFAYPEDFYSPDYSTRPTGDPKDYRRTLYWNPNARTDENGQFVANFFNNGHETRIKVSAAGITSDGRFLFTK